MTLEKAYKIGVKYGFTFNGVGPSLSVVDGKTGICLNVLDDNFGYIRRNFTFDNPEEYDEFLKKYSYYLHHKDEENLYLVLDDYESSNPKIIYSNELEENAKAELEFKNKEILIKTMRDFLNNFINSLEQIRAEITEKILVEQDYYNKLNYYQSLLYKAFNTEFNEEALSASKEEIEKFNSDVKDFDLNNKRLISSIDLGEKSFGEINSLYDQLFNDCKKFISDEKYMKIIFNKIKFKNNIDVLDKMIDYLLKNPTAGENTDKELDDIKQNNSIEIDFDMYKNEYIDKYVKKYEGLESGTYNEELFAALKPEYFELDKEEKHEKKKISDLKEIFETLDDDQQRAINLIHSPLKPLILYIIEQAYFKNKKFNFDRAEFKHIYDVVCKCFKNSENLVFKLKYFKNVDFNSYESFIKSIVKVAKSICFSYTKLPFDIKLYSLNYDACMISASDSNIKNGSDSINVINAKEGCSYIYSPIKITYDKNTYLLSTESNDNVIYFPRYLNSSKKDKDIVTLNIFEEGYSIDKIKNTNLLIITKFDLDKSIKYKYSTMTSKEKN